MHPNFFKKLGPINIKEIKSKIDCVPINIAEDQIYDDLVNINQIDKNLLSFLYDKETVISDFNEDSTIICSEKKAKEIDENKKILVVKNVQKSVAEISNIFF